jgi:hypothetical protein
MTHGRVVPVFALLTLVGCSSSGSLSVASPPSTTSVPAALGSLAPGDLVTIGRSAGMLSTRPHAHVQAFKAPGRVVWARFNPDVHNIDTDEYLAHDLIVVRSTDDVPDLFGGGPVETSSGAAHRAKDVAVSLILDASNGRVVETSGEGPGAVRRLDPALLGTPTEVTLP